MKNKKLYVVFNETTEVSEYLLIPKDADVSDELKKKNKNEIGLGERPEVKVKRY